MTAGQPNIILDNLTTGYRSAGSDVIITSGISAALYPGELTCLLGPNGAGKSTLLKTLTAFMPPLGGDVFVEGRRLSDYNSAELARVIGIVTTERLTVNNMTVEELVALGRSPYTGFWGRLSASDRRIVDESISLAGITELRKRRVNTLSDGERQKSMIAKALAQQTPVIFLDEPTAFLDYPGKVEMMLLLRSLARTGAKTIFLSTHDLELALQIADKAWLLSKTLGLTIGTPEDLALDGDMNRYFERPGVSFDADSGLFRVNHEIEREVCLRGEGPVFVMARKALLRNGLNPVCEPSDITITTGDNTLSVNGISASSIAEMLTLIKKNL